MDITDVVKAATRKFGEVITVSRKDENEYLVVCKRAEPTFPERPYMTITAIVATEEPQRVAFYWGHYDLTVQQAHSTIAAALAPKLLPALKLAERLINQSGMEAGECHAVIRAAITEATQQ